MVEDFEIQLKKKQDQEKEAMRLKLEALKRKEDEKKTKHLQKMVENMGGYEKGDRLLRVVGQKKDAETGQVLCLCEWNQRKDGTWPIKTFLPFDILVEKDPKVVI